MSSQIEKTRVHNGRAGRVVKAGMHTYFSAMVGRTYRGRHISYIYKMNGKGDGFVSTPMSPEETIKVIDIINAEYELSLTI